MVLEEKLKLRIIDFLVHYRCFKQGTLPDDKLYQSVDHREHCPITGDHNFDSGPRYHPLVLLLGPGLTGLSDVLGGQAPLVLVSGVGLTIEGES